MERKIIIFDLEGPLSPADHAYEVMKTNPDGKKVFEILSRYDDLLTLEERKGYESGDTLKLIVPFLVFWNIRESDLLGVSLKTGLISGADVLVKKLQSNGWKVYIDSTSYEQHAKSIAGRVGVLPENIFCTKFPLDQFRKSFEGKNIAWLKDEVFYITKILWQGQKSDDWNDARIKATLDGFYADLQKDNDWKKIFSKMKVCGGERKVAAVRKICKINGVKLGDLAVVGDSITDFKMLEAVKKSGGLAIAFNANEYALPYANVGIASQNLNDLEVILGEFIFGGLDSIKSLCNSAQGFEKSGPYYHWLEGKSKEKMEEILRIHKNFREKIRGQAAKLG